jgi:hypothetical protein
MTPRRGSRHPVSPTDARAYLSKAKTWLEAAVESLDSGRWDVAAGSAVTAGISACDPLTGALVGQRAGGEHDEALSLLAIAGDDGRYAARQLSQLLRFKTAAQYDPAPLPVRDARKAVELARRLTDRASMVIERRGTYGTDTVSVVGRSYPQLPQLLENKPNIVAGAFAERRHRTQRKKSRSSSGND